MKRLSPSPSSSSGGFTLLPLPPAPPSSDSKLRRCSSLPVDPPNAAIPPELMAGSRDHLLSSQGLPLLRTISDPNPCLSYSSPPNSNPIGGSRVDSRSPSSGSDSPASKRLKRMGERMKEMKNWFDQLIQQTDQDSDSETGNHEAEDIIEKKNMESHGPFEEAESNVSAYRQGDAINIRCKCPCGDSYQILLMGQDYYYKLL